MPEILRSIGVIARSLDSISNIEFKEIELTKGQYLYVVRIGENPGIILEDLANIIKIDKATASRALQKLEKNGFIERKNDEINKKIKKLYLSEKGKEIYPFIKRENEHSNNKALQGLTNAEKDQIKKLLSKVQKNIESDWDLVKNGGKRIY
ncbi:MarR family winged helix-turn-helix transcriptional regulator [Companilactobacillus baiquanensis]|uniref:MarR family winged helix-turn-helix transcriptional regulator n=1 Tax=Companilactobacillus baiquanensis TaxID=2486005 RepID=A0ABW1UU32_9LACO|nr:MarR family transcriptional regulator [Companilactobacillus baiquanensis]